MDFTKAELYLLLNLRPESRPLWLTGADLSSADLRHADLRGADLAHANLKGAQMKSSQIDGADLRHAVLPDGEIWKPEADLSKYGIKGRAKGGSRVDIGEVG